MASYIDDQQLPKNYTFPSQLNLVSSAHKKNRDIITWRTSKFNVIFIK